MRKVKIILIVVLAIGVALVVSCSKPFNKPRIEPSENGEFLGLRGLLASAPDNTIDVLVVHGMCTHGKEWAEKAVSNLNSAIGGGQGVQLKEVAVDGTQVLLYQQRLTSPAGVVRANAIVWSPVLAPLKNQVCYDQTTKSNACLASGLPQNKYPYERASLNARFKDVMLNDCLVDAIIYQGRSRDAISEQFQKSIIQALGTVGKGAPDENPLAVTAKEVAPLVVLTDSLGSKVTFDAIYKLVTSADPEKAAAGERTFDRVAQIFMQANQWPLLALADQRIDEMVTRKTTMDGYPPDPIASLSIKRRKFRTAKMPIKLRVVAFTDPNDLLSYALHGAKRDDSYDVVDVIVSNDNTYLKMIENPYTAHKTYGENDAVNKLIACGNPIKNCE